MLKILVVGGDRRMLLLSELLRAEGFAVQTIGLQPGDEKMGDPMQADAVLFPYPVSVRDGFTPTLTGITVRPQDVPLKPNAVILCGAGVEKILPTPVCHYDQAPGFLQKNAELSAEAAVSDLMTRTDLALSDMQVMVLGYGRFGRALALRLKTLGTQVTIAARREPQRLQAQKDHMQAIPLEQFSKKAAQMDAVLNTIPSPVLSPKDLSVLRPQTWLLELASAPYGFDRKIAAGLGLSFDVLPGLPARYAPRSAAMALKQACLTLIKEKIK